MIHARATGHPPDPIPFPDDHPYHCTLDEFIALVISRQAAKAAGDASPRKTGQKAASSGQS